MSKKVAFLYLCLGLKLYHMTEKDRHSNVCTFFAGKL